MAEFDLHDHKIGHWREVAQYIYEHVPSGKFVFSDETEQFNGPYDTKDEAIAACKAYAEAL